jgi:hypothetical protein
VSDQPEYTPDQLAAAKAEVQPPPVGTGPDAGMVADRMPAATPTSVDADAMLAMQRQIAQLQEQMAAMQGASATGAGEHAAVSNAKTLRGLISQHFEFHHKRAELEGLADDVVDAAGNAVESGDAGALRNVTEKLARRLRFFNPGPGDHHYYRQALGFVTDHIPDAADTITDQRPSSAPEIGSDRAPAKVVAGSVTG